MVLVIKCVQTTASHKPDFYRNHWTKLRNYYFIFPETQKYKLQTFKFTRENNIALLTNKHTTNTSYIGAPKKQD